MTEDEVRRVADYAVTNFINNHFEWRNPIARAKGIAVDSTIHQFVEGHEWPEVDWDAIQREQDERKNNDG